MKLLIVRLSNQCTNLQGDVNWRPLNYNRAWDPGCGSLSQLTPTWAWVPDQALAGFSACSRGSSCSKPDFQLADNATMCGTQQVKVPSPSCKSSGLKTHPQAPDRPREEKLESDVWWKRKSQTDVVRFPEIKWYSFNALRSEDSCSSNRPCPRLWRAASSQSRSAVISRC